MESAQSPFNVLESFRIAPRVYSLVPVRGERFLTLKHQQVRAVNLARALAPGGPKRVCVVGAGLAGLTCAAMLAQVLQKDVTLRILERNSVELWNLRGCHIRWLHPNFFTWPEPGWWDARARVPVLAWEAGSAHKVHDEIIHQWNTLVRGHDIAVTTDVRDVQVSSSEERATVQWRSQNEKAGRAEDFDAVAIAIGPGTEHEGHGALNGSYWHADNLDREDPSTPEGVRRYVIAGSGDGALTDVLRLRLRSFVKHEKIQEIARRIDQSTIERLLALDDDLKQGGAAALAEFEALAALHTDLVEGDLRRNNDVLIVSTEPHPYTLGFLVNRFLVAIVAQHRLGMIRHERGRARGVAQLVGANESWVIIDAEVPGAAATTTPTPSPPGPRTHGHQAHGYVHRVGVHWNEPQRLLEAGAPRLPSITTDTSARLAQFHARSRFTTHGRKGSRWRLVVATAGRTTDLQKVDLVVCPDGLPDHLPSGTAALAWRAPQLELSCWDERGAREVVRLHQDTIALLEIRRPGLPATCVVLVDQLPHATHLPDVPATPGHADGLFELLGESSHYLIVALRFAEGVRDDEIDRDAVVASWRQHCRCPMLEAYAPSEAEATLLSPHEEECRLRLATLDDA